jgi:uncharacterized membrane protein
MSSIDPSRLPLMAPCRAVPLGATRRWLALGWHDLRRAPRASLSYGVIMVVVSHVVTLATWRFGNLGLYLGLVSGFVFVGPWLALTWYAISRRLARHQPVTVLGSLRDAAQSISGAMVFAVILLVVFLVWARAATLVHVFFPAMVDPHWRDLLWFLGVGSAVGAVFCAVIFAASAFALPMLLDRQVDAVTAVITSINAVLRNKRAMVPWALTIVATVVLGAITGWLAFVVLMPWLGHATWHAYCDTIDSRAWPPIDG